MADPSGPRSALHRLWRYRRMVDAWENFTRVGEVYPTGEDVYRCGQCWTCVAGEEARADHADWHIARGDYP